MGHTCEVKHFFCVLEGSTPVRSCSNFSFHECISVAAKMWLVNIFDS